MEMRVNLHNENGQRRRRQTKEDALKSNIAQHSLAVMLSIIHWIKIKFNQLLHCTRTV